MTLEQTTELAEFIPTIFEKVGVFVSPSRAELLEAVDKVGFGLCTSSRSRVVDKLFENLPCASIQAVQVGGNGHVPKFSGRLLLFDAPVAGKWSDTLTGGNWTRQN